LTLAVTEFQRSYRMLNSVVVMRAWLIAMHRPIRISFKAE